MSEVKITAYQIQEQAHYMEAWKAASSEVDDIAKARGIKRGLQRDYPGIKYRIVRKTLIIEVME